MIKVLFIGDVNAKPGRKAVKDILPGLAKEKNIDFVIANGENSAGGFGITEKTMNELLAAGINSITTGNHVWDKKEALAFIDSAPALLRPANLPENNPGRGHNVYTIEKDGRTVRIAVACLNGRVFMDPAGDPFKKADEIIAEVSKTTPVIIFDFHAEATSEKAAMGFFLDGRVSAVIGTHTHIQTSDNRVLPKGTAYMTDAGMTGPFDSVIGVKKETIIKRFTTGISEAFEIAKGDVHFCGAIISIDKDTGKASSIERLDIKHE